MESLAGEQKLCFQGGGPIGFDEFQITVFVGAVDFVADDGVTDVREMDANLVGSAGFGFGFDQGERAIVEDETVQNTKRGEGSGSVGMGGLFQVDFRGSDDALAQ